jgi:acyl-CoA reductase-like NAD-dependent aldehyde dehydrogenase
MSDQQPTWTAVLGLLLVVGAGCSKAPLAPAASSARPAPVAGKVEVDDAAAAALPGWRSTPAIQRARILRKAADLMRERATEIATAMTSEQGKALAEAKGEVEYAASFFEWFAGEAERVVAAYIVPAELDDLLQDLQEELVIVWALSRWNQ